MINVEKQIKYTKQDKKSNMKLSEEIAGTNLLMKFVTLTVGFTIAMLGLVLVLNSLQQTTAVDVAAYFIIGVVFFSLAGFFVWRMLGRKLSYSQERVTVKGLFGSNTIYLMDIARIGNMAINQSRGGKPISVKWVEVILLDGRNVRLGLNPFPYEAGMKCISILRKHLEPEESLQKFATKCKKCGSSLPKGATFCAKCGTFS